MVLNDGIPCFVRVADDHWVNLSEANEILIVSDTSGNEEAIELAMSDGSTVRIDDADSYNNLFVWLTSLDYDARSGDES